LINLNIYAIKRTTESIPHLKRLDAIEAVVQNITALVDDLMTMARLDSGTARVVRPVDVNQMLGDLVAIMRDFANRGKLNIVQDFDPNGQVYVQATPEELNLAFKNILENAIRYTPENGTITVRTTRQTANLVIEIQDTGVGMSEEVVAHVFERFYRVDEAHTTRGFGLGLPIAQKIVHMHNGTIEAESTPGKGSTFRIILPA
jgi:signal transduction histidine kinase